MSSIYQEIILDHHRNPRNFGSLDHTAKQVTVKNPLCGDSLTFSMITQGSRIKDIKFQGEGCAISVASASLLTEYVKGKNLSTLRKLDSSFILGLLNIELSPNRLKCALLSLEGVQKIIA